MKYRDGLSGAWIPVRDVLLERFYLLVLIVSTVKCPLTCMISYQSLTLPDLRDFSFFNYFVFSVFLYIPEWESSAQSMWFSMMVTHHSHHPRSFWQKIFWNEKNFGSSKKMRFSLFRQLEKCKMRLKEKVYSKSDYAEALRKT